MVMRMVRLKYDRRGEACPEREGNSQIGVESGIVR